MSEQNRQSPAPQAHRGPMMRGPMGGGPMGMHSGEKAKALGPTLKKLLRYLRADWLRLAVVVVFATASTVFAIVSPKILGTVTTSIADDFIAMTLYDRVHEQLPAGMQLPPGTTGESLLPMMPAEMRDKLTDAQLDILKGVDLAGARPGIRFEAIGQTALLLCALYLLSAAFSYIQGFITSGVAQRVTYGLRRSISEKMARLPLSYFDTRTHGEVLSCVTTDVDTITSTLGQSMTQIVTSLTTLVGIVAMMLSINLLMTLIALLILPVSMLVVGFVVKRSQKLFTAQQASLGALSGRIEETYGGHSAVKLFAAGDKLEAEFDNINGDIKETAWKSQFLSGLMFPLMNLLGNVGYVGVCVLGGNLAAGGSLPIGDIQAFIQYLRQMNQPIAGAAQIMNVLQSTAAAAERVFEFLEEPEMEDESRKAPADPAETRGAVSLSHIDFGYDPDRRIIRDFSAEVSPGQRVAIVGPTGAGKTTVVNLLMRFYDPQSGEIRLDGRSTGSMRREDVCRHFSMVLQDAWLFSGTVRENLKFGRPEATDDEMKAACRAAHVHSFVSALPGGYDMKIDEEGEGLSQGQKQLLTIARAMIENAPMLILDEATSSVDTRTEVLIQKAMDALMRGRTSFVIAHRLSTIRDADLILVMNDGAIVETGTHGELMAQKGFYEGLYNSQFSA